MFFFAEEMNENKAGSFAKGDNGGMILRLAFDATTDETLCNINSLHAKTFSVLFAEINGFILRFFRL